MLDISKRLRPNVALRYLYGNDMYSASGHIGNDERPESDRHSFQGWRLVSTVCPAYCLGSLFRMSTIRNPTPPSGSSALKAFQFMPLTQGGPNLAQH